MTSLLLAQPDITSRKKVNGTTVFQDMTDPFLYYYEPGELFLSHNTNDEPDFQFLDMRYTGSKCYNDQGEKNFMSLLQFGVEMKKMTADSIMAIKRALKNRAIKLVPVPITQIRTQLVIGSIENEEEKIQKDGALDAKTKAGYSTSKTYWTKRSFTIKLNNHESQVLNDQLRNGRLGISLDYEYYADFKKNDEMEAAGSKELIEALSEEYGKAGEITENRILKSDVLPIRIDVEKYPDTIKQMDLNEEVPPAYAGTEIRCYDFKNNLRSDLYIKIVEIQAQSVSNEKEVIVTIKFLKSHSDIHTKYISFPYAIYVNAPMRYRVTEITIDGDRTVSEWMSKESCSSVIDITTQF
ncbi:hypothetical protein [Maribacter sp. MAR_2009_72]|uniref:hypothetical protein n=1 Tax=Maribacter sp. MAR_2009_72 TaxID=1250050 RepID=UPI0011A1CE35|nr:hypothetical protein [Maribacter sp. MAR_2009_72]